MQQPSAKKTSSSSLGGKLIFLRHQLRRDRFPESQDSPSPASPLQTPPPNISRQSPRPITPQQPSLEEFSTDWTEPRTFDKRHPRRARQHAEIPSDVGVKLHLSPAAEPTRRESSRTELTSPRHKPMPATQSNKPNAPPHDPSVIGYLAVGGSRVFKLKHEVRVQRNRVIFISVLCVVFLLIIWSLFIR